MKPTNSAMTGDGNCSFVAGTTARWYSQLRFSRKSSSPTINHNHNLIGFGWQATNHSTAASYIIRMRRMKSRWMAPSNPLHSDWSIDRDTVTLRFTRQKEEDEDRNRKGILHWWRSWWWLDGRLEVMLSICEMCWISVCMFYLDGLVT